ncbi:Major Facilitator Superfamily protein [Streptomyces sp. 3213]|uniref:MFS transporter n=1 Tax=Streptomyces sp. 3213.3 TaxID=1855348 RepID=UPI0008975358|nr:MFS transporter [Streptomyces sp. 3213.3]SEC83368.1 Major Facilitator Superfamily protein [Streptomyces sp. 3213] [Streptomyces sp. 3213.3]
MSSQTQLTPRRDDERSPSTTRNVLVVVALVWTVQLVALIAALSGIAQADIAIHFRTTEIAWFTLMTLLTGTFFLPFAVKAAAIFGKKRVLLVATGLGFTGDLIAAVATDYRTLLIGRGIAGIYTASAPLAYAITRDVFPRKWVGVASGILAGGVGLVAFGGPFLSGWLLDNYGFRGVLWFMAISTAASFLLVLAFVPESPIRAAAGRMDWAGGILLGGGVTAIIYAVGQGTHWGWGSGRFIAWVVGAAIALIAFVFVERKVAEPLFPLSMTRRRPVWTVLLATSIAAGSLSAVGVVIQLLILMPKIPTISEGLGWSGTHNAIVTSPISAMIIIGAVGTGLLSRRMDARILLGTGAALAVLGYGIGTHLHHSAPQIIEMGVIAGLGTGIVMAVVPIMIIEVVTPEEQALANGVQTLGQGVAQIVVSQLAFVVMAQHGAVLKGTQFYLDAGFTNGLWLVVGCVAAGSVLVALIPRSKRLDEVEVGQAV